MRYKLKLFLLGTLCGLGYLDTYLNNIPLTLEMVKKPYELKDWFLSESMTYKLMLILSIKA